MSDSDDLIYLDYNATTPIDPRVADAMQPCLTGCQGNPSSGHRAGREARAQVDRAREAVAKCIGASADEIVFTSGGSESNNLALRGHIASLPRGHGPRDSTHHVITSAIEHPAVLEVVRALEDQGRIRLTIVDVDAAGRVRPENVQRALTDDTVLVSIMLANNETGALQPVQEVARTCKARGVTVHTDAAQAVGKIPVDVDALGVDMLTIAGHKLYAPKGVGALYVRHGTKLEPVIRGANHERGLRAGTENVLGLTGLGAACALLDDGLGSEMERVRDLRDRLQSMLTSGHPSAVINGPQDDRLPNTLSIALVGVDADRLLASLTEQVAASAGAACHAGDVKMSTVLSAMGVSSAVGRATLRLSVGRFTTEADIDRAAGLILAAAASLSA